MSVLSMAEAVRSRQQSRIVEKLAQAEDSEVLPTESVAVAVIGAPLSNGKFASGCTIRMLQPVVACDPA